MTNEEALNILHNSSVYHPMYLDALNMAIEALEQQPTRPIGKWETLVEDYNKCSKCGEMGKLYRIYKYCPNCGARMEGTA